MNSSRIKILGQILLGSISQQLENYATKQGLDYYFKSGFRDTKKVSIEKAINQVIKSVKEYEDNLGVAIDDEYILDHTINGVVIKEYMEAVFETEIEDYRKTYKLFLDNNKGIGIFPMLPKFSDN